jgi:hypothetical protein
MVNSEIFVVEAAFVRERERKREREETNVKKINLFVSAFSLSREHCI